MSVLQMQHITICAHKKDRKKLLEILQLKGIIELNNVIEEDNILRKDDMTYAKNILEKNVTIAEEAIELVNKYSKPKVPMLSILNGRKELSKEIYDAFFEKHDIVLVLAKNIIELNKNIIESKAEILKLEAQKDILSPWEDLDISLNFTGTKNTSCFIGTLPGEYSLEKIYTSLAEHMPVEVEVISSSKEQTCVFILCSKDNESSVMNTLRGIGFSYPNSGIDLQPSIKMNSIDVEITKLENIIEESEQEIISHSENLEDLHFLADYDSMRAEKYEMINHLLQSKNVFFLTGYIPANVAEETVELLNKKFELSVELRSPSEEEEVPVLLKNNKFANPLEGVVESFSPPGKGEIDPTMIMSLFYYMLFGLMLSDAGYGFLIAAFCAYGLIKFKGRLEETMERTLRMYLLCGLATVFWGVMFGSYFGDIVDVISETFFGSKVTIPPLWFFPVNEPMRMLTFSLLLGLIHLMFGLGTKSYQCIKNKDFKGFIYDCIFWYGLVLGLTIILLTMDMITTMLGVQLSIPTNVKNIATYIAILSAFGIVLTNGRESKNPFKRFLKGLYALYGISGYLSDVLSYSRLLALGLATGVIGSVINQMASMVGSGIISAVIFTIIVISGHALNIGINALGAYVHTNRLQYVEFFGKFYEGGGRMFKPFTMNTKYYKFKEKN